MRVLKNLKWKPSQGIKINSSYSLGYHTVGCLTFFVHLKICQYEQGHTLNMTQGEKPNSFKRSQLNV